MPYEINLSSPPASAIDPFWWKSKKNYDVANALFSIVVYLDETQKHIKEANLAHLRLYGNSNLTSSDLYRYQQVKRDFSGSLKLNIIKAVIDTLSSKLAKNDPRPTFLTSGGNWEEQRKAEKLGDAIEAFMFQDETHQKGKDIFIDGLVWGTGALKIFSKEGKPCSERTLVDELKVDMADAYYGYPRNLYQTKYYNREILLGMFQEERESKAIKLVGAEVPQGMLASNEMRLTDQIKVVEAWHLPSYSSYDPEEPTDGKHIIAIANKTLLEEEWRYPNFPFVFFRPSKKRLGFWGCGAAEELTPIQVELNRTLITLQDSMRLCAIPRVLKESSSDIVNAHINNEIGSIIEYSGIKPEFWTSGAIPPEIMQHILWLWSIGFEQYGVSQLSATSRKPDGLDSKPALREYNDIETERFMLMGQGYERVFVEIAQQFVRECKSLYEEDPKLSVMSIKKKHNVKYLEEIKWKDVDIDNKDYKIQIFPVSSLPSRPEGRIQTVQEWVQAGMIPPDEGLRLLDFPDTKSYISYANAHLDDIDMVIYEMLDSGTYQSPEPYQDLGFGIKRVQSAYLRGRIDKVPEAKLELLRTWIAEATDLLNKAANPAPEQVGAPLPEEGIGASGNPLANPEPTPTSELVPNTALQ